MSRTGEEIDDPANASEVRAVRFTAGNFGCIGSSCLAHFSSRGKVHSTMNYQYESLRCQAF